MDKKNNLKERIKNSHFIVNKLYIFLSFILLTISSLSLGVIYFFISLYIYIKKLITASVPMEVNEDIKVETYIYKKTSKRDLKIDIYYPNTNTDYNPIIYFCHGGAWISGFRDQPSNVSWCKFLASRGFVVSSIDYRYGYNNTMLDLMTDYMDGLNFIRENSNSLKINSNNISLMGLSAGGHLALLYASYLSYHNMEKELKGIRSIVAYYPPTNLKDLIDDENSKSLLAKFGASRTLKESPSEFKDVYKYYSPNSWLSPRMLPVLLVHGKEDDTVPFNSSINFAKLLKLQGSDYEFLVHSKANHSFDTQLNDYTTIDILEKTVRFIKKNLE